MSEKPGHHPEKRLIPHPISREKAAEAQPLARDVRKKAIGEYRNLLREAEADRRMVRVAQTRRTELVAKSGGFIADKRELAKVDAELGRWISVFSRQKRQIDLLREKYGDSLDRAHREYVKEKLNFVNFTSSFRRLHGIDRAIRDFGSVPAQAAQTPGEAKKRGVAAQMERGYMTTIEGLGESSGELEENAADMADALDYIFGKDETELREKLKAEILESAQEQEEEEEQPLETMSLPQLKRLRGDLFIECEEAWEKPGVQRRWFEREFDGWVRANLRSARVLEFPSVVKIMNELDDIERTYRNTTIGGVLVGEPGVGKTTMINHYLEKKGRKTVYIDMSEEVTRYQMFGSPGMQTESNLDQFKRLAQTVADMGDEEISQMVKEHASKLAPTLDALSDEERQVIAFDQLQEQLSAANVKDLRDRFEGIVRKQFRSEMAKKLADITKKNGWRDGIVIHALRNGYSLIVDEFNKAKSWTLLHHLTETAPGTQYYFADNNEWIDIPENWRMYFTGNIGKKHGTYSVREAFASRIGGKVMQIDTPSPEEERSAMIAFLCDSDSRLMRPTQDIVNLLFFVRDVVPKIRHTIVDGRNVIPVSYRLLRDLAEQLVDYEKMRPREKTLDEALLRVLIRPYSVFETREISQTIAKLCMDAGLLLGEEVESDVAKWTGLSKEEIRKRREEHAQEAGNPDEMLKKFRDSDQASMTAALPLVEAV